MSAAQALVVLRVAVAALLAVHGWARLLNDAVAPFGGFLDAAGIPAGLAVAWGVTALEIAGTPLLAAGQLAQPLAVAYAVVYTAGIALVHAPAGWFVVGLGRNGMEYSVLLIVCLGLIAATARVR